MGDSRMAYVFSAGLGVAVSLLVATSAHALNARTWVSGAGVDQAGCGPIANPCRTLQYAHDNTENGGEIDIKDSAAYGAVVIFKAISIVSDGSLAGVYGPSVGAAIHLDPNTGAKVYLRGLTIQGPGGLDSAGIRAGSDVDLTVDRCVIKNFATGLLFGPGLAPKVTVNDSDVVNNRVGLKFVSSTGGSVSISRSRFNKNTSYGITLTGVAASKFSISDTAVNDNSTGLGIDGANPTILDGVTILSNTIQGLAAGGGGTLLLGRSTIVGNGQGVNLAPSVSALSYRNNQINGNGQDIAGTFQTAPLQ